MGTMKARSGFRRRSDKLPANIGTPGLPPVNYYLPVVVTLLSTLLLLVVVAFLTVVAVGNTTLAWNAFGTGAANAPAWFLLCGALTIIGTGLSIFFLFGVIKGVRDLAAPLNYTRGILLDKRTVAGRLAGEWIGVSPVYVGPDVALAGQVTDEQAAASVDRTQIVRPRGDAPPPRPRRGRYIAEDRISVRPDVEYAPQAATQEGPRLVFRVDQDTYSQIEPGEDVLIAHSRYLEHIFYVSHLRNGEWVSFKNKALI